MRLADRRARLPRLGHGAGMGAVLIVGAILFTWGINWGLPARLFTVDGVRTNLDKVNPTIQIFVRDGSAVGQRVR